MQSGKIRLIVSPVNAMVRINPAMLALSTDFALVSPTKDSAHCLDKMPSLSIASGVLRVLTVLAGLALSGCEEHSLATMSAAFDSDRYRVQVSDSQFSVYDHQRGILIWNSSMNQLLQAHRTDLRFTESHGSYQHQITVHETCTQPLIDKAESQRHSLLIAGNFDSPGECSALRFAIRISVNQDGLRIIASTSNPQFNHLSLGFSAPSDEIIMGFGAQTSRLNFKSERVPVWVQEQGVGRGREPLSTLVNSQAQGAAGHELSSYMPLPQFLSSHRYSIALENPEFSEFDFLQPDNTQIHAYSPVLRLRFTSCERLLDCITSNARINGPMRRLPEWIHNGAVVALQGGGQRVMEIYDQLKAANTPISALWIQDWVGQRITLNGHGRQLWWHWERDQDLYPDWHNMVNRLNRDGVRIMGYFNPFLVDTSEHLSRQRNLYQEAKSQGFLIRDAQGDIYQVKNTDFSASLVDLSNPKAFNWLKSVIKEQVSVNQFSGWMADFGEAFPTDVELHSGQDALSFHNQFPQEWARLNAEVVRELGLRGDAVFFMRSGFTRSPAITPLFWLGDQNTSWDIHDGLQSAVVGLINSGLSGMTLNHADIGGYTSIRQQIPQLAAWVMPDEFVERSIPGANGIPSPAFSLHRRSNLLKRWIEVSAFTPVFRSHEGLSPGINVQVYDQEVRDHFAKFAQLHKALFPYRRTLIDEASVRGWPLVRHPLLHFPEQTVFEQMAPHELQFMLGDSIMVAPMLTPRNEKVSRRVFLPPGTWIDLWSGESISVYDQAVTLRRTPEMGQPPVFLLDNDASSQLIVPSLRDAGMLEQWPSAPASP
ncbi:alpha-glucosidase [Pseudomaricurvus alkylphenolicus]|uniref:alpha-glucosidase n=1 Tax=Pseudomaricurvus alkylphenolicus TaxID=1306991 RepID=UPI001422D980|nr:alpha-glucosidase [Pseudomaricurvus alkylphenolicus]NIB41798.1 alpha-glucosidase [Pseudomaricurvus alkylphenolicus]